MTSGKTVAKVRMCSFRSASVAPYGIHCIMTPPSVRWSRPAS